MLEFLYTERSFELRISLSSPCQNFRKKTVEKSIAKPIISPIEEEAMLPLSVEFTITFAPVFVAVPASTPFSAFFHHSICLRSLFQGYVT